MITTFMCQFRKSCNGWQKVSFTFVANSYTAPLEKDFKIDANGARAFRGHFLCGIDQGSPNYGPWAKSDPRSHFIRPAKTYCQKWKTLYETFVDLIDVTYPKTITLRKDVRPSYCCVIAYVVIGDPWCRQWCSQDRNLRDRDRDFIKNPETRDLRIETETSKFVHCAGFFKIS